jgi:hypothetical protein
MSMSDRRQHGRLPVGERQRFIVARQDATYANPYGFPDLSMCFWPATFMRGGLKFWVQFTEKYGSPWVIGKHPRGANDEETDLLLDSLEAMVQDAVAAIPDDASVQIIEAAGKAGSADVYRQLLEYCRSEINVAMLGQNQTTEKDSNRANATAGAEVTHDIRDGAAGIVAAALTPASATSSTSTSVPMSPPRTTNSGNKKKSTKASPSATKPLPNPESNSATPTGNAPTTCKTATSSKPQPSPTHRPSPNPPIGQQATKPPSTTPSTACRPKPCNNTPSKPSPP